MTMSVALFDCPHCIDEFAFDYDRIKNLGVGWRVMVLCPGCGNVIEVVMQAYQLIHNCHRATYKWGQITEILPPSPQCPPGLNYSLHMAIHRKKYGTRRESIRRLYHTPDGDHCLEPSSAS